MKQSGNKADIDNKAALDNYDKAEAQLKAFTRSAVRTKVLLALKDGELPVGDLGSIMGIRSTTILHSMKDMIDTDLVIKTNRGYSLTNIGKAQALLLDELVSAIVVLGQHRDFWLDHDMSGIPENLFTKIGMLAESERIMSDYSDPMKSLENFMAELMTSEEIRGVSSMLIPGFAEVIANCVRRGATVDLILTDEILSKISDENPDLLMEVKDYDNFQLHHLSNEVKVAFTVTESLVALGLFRTDGLIDIGNDLICIGEKATAWGKELFDYYKDISERVI